MKITPKDYNAPSVSCEATGRLSLSFFRWDTSGEERFKSITNAYYRGSHGELRFSISRAIYVLYFDGGVVKINLSNVFF